MLCYSMLSHPDSWVIRCMRKLWIPGCLSSKWTGLEANYYASKSILVEWVDQGQSTIVAGHDKVEDEEGRSHDQSHDLLAGLF